MVSSFELMTERFLLRPFRDGDFEAVHAYGSDPEVVRFMPWGPNSEEDTRQFLRRAASMLAEEPPSAWELAVVEREGGRLLGGVGLHPDGSNAMLGYCLARPAWGRGVATEAGRALVDFGFRELEIHRVWAGCDPENAGSIRVLEKLGMRREGRLREECRIRGEWRDTLVYAVLEEEWREMAAP